MYRFGGLEDLLKTWTYSTVALCYRISGRADNEEMVRKKIWWKKMIAWGEWSRTGSCRIGVSCGMKVGDWTKFGGYSLSDEYTGATL